MGRMMKLVAATVIVAVITPIAASGVMLATYLFLPLPANLPERTGHQTAQISRVYDSAGNQIGTYKQFESSIPSTPEDTPDVLKKAVVAAEDRGFYSHGGVDIRGTFRALLADVRNQRAAQGGSTITQQLVKITTDNGKEKSVLRKLREAVLASQLDRSMDKEDILFEYISNVYLGEGAYGAAAAAQTYFRKPVKDLTLSEAALLAGVIPAPSRYSPRADPTAAEEKRKIVLGSMLDTGAIDQAAYDAALLQTVWLAANGPAPGPATVVYPAETQQSSEPGFSDYVLKWLERHLPGGTTQVYRDGLKIETTLDPDQQAAARKQVDDFLKGLAPDLRTSLVAVEPPTGYVRAFVNGNADFTADRVNYALGKESAGGVGGGGSGRQPGSAFKPFVLAQALTEGITPEARYSGAPHDVTKPCGKDEKGNNVVLDNYGGERFGTISLREATVHSVNTVYTRLILDVGVANTLALAQQMGLHGIRSDGCASVALGAESVSPLDMASAYGVFANHGERVEPTPVLRVTDRDGKVLIDNSKPEASRVLKADVADNVTNILQGVLESGTAAGKGLGARPAAGKTGTTESNKDAWFVGFTPTLSTAVWMGFQNPPTQAKPKFLRGIKGVAKVTGGTHPAKIWQAFMTSALKNVPITKFTEPAPILGVPDAAKRRQRNGFEPGARQLPGDADNGGPYVESPVPPVADDPTTTTLFVPPTTTTAPGGLFP